MIAYLKPTDDGALEGMEIKPVPTYKKAEYVLCPLCMGYGGWILKKGTKQKCFCSQCWGWGHVEADGPHATCVHEWESKRLGMHLHRKTCTKCGFYHDVDSSG